MRQQGHVDHDDYANDQDDERDVQHPRCHVVSQPQRFEQGLHRAPNVPGEQASEVGLRVTTSLPPTRDGQVSLRVRARDALAQDV